MVRIIDVIRKRWNIFSKTLRDFWRFLDGPDWVFISIAFIVFVTIMAAGFRSWPSVAVALFTAIYAFVAQNQMRQEAQTYTANVRRDFEYNSDNDSYDFGLRNFGPGPALYLRVYATVTEQKDSGEEEIVEQDVLIEEDDPPMSLREGEFESLLDKNFLELDPENDHHTLNLYYSYISRNGVETPEDQHNPREKCHKKLVKDTPDPRTIEFEKIRENCILESNATSKVK